MTILKKINYIFSTKQKVQSVFLCIGLLIGALLELVKCTLGFVLVKKGVWVRNIVS